MMILDNVNRLLGDDLKQTIINKAYYWSVRAPKLGPYSCSLLDNILATGQFEWIQQHHQYWSHLEMKCTVEKTMFGKQSSIITHHVVFADQVLVIILISKFRTQSCFKFTNLLTRDIAICIIKQLAHVWFL